MLRLLRLPRNHPRIKEQIKNIQKEICDVKNRLVFCCGSNQLPPTPIAELNNQIQNDEYYDDYYEDDEIICSQFDGYRWFFWEKEWKN